MKIGTWNRYGIRELVIERRSARPPGPVRGGGGGMNKLDGLFTGH